MAETLHHGIAVSPEGLLHSLEGGIIVKYDAGSGVISATNPSIPKLSVCAVVTMGEVTLYVAEDSLQERWELLLREDQ